jgi:predicted nuclease of predicted toxin-antitoxin system
MRFHLDEHVDHAVARGLRERGVDVTTSTDAGLLGKYDNDHLEFALRESRVIVTHDADFLRLACKGQGHVGIAYCQLGSRTVGQIVRHLCLMHDCVSPDEMVGRIEYL